MFEKTLNWIKKDNNLRIAETGSSVLFVFIFIFYFYGFRSGFQFRIEDIGDILFDMFIILVSSIVIIRAFSKLALWQELESANLKELNEKHKKKVEEVNHDIIDSKIKQWNEKEVTRKVNEKKQKDINKLKRKRGTLQNVNKPKKRKIKRVTKRIEKLEDVNTIVKVKHHWVTSDEILIEGIYDGKDKEILTNYNVVKDVTKTQSSTVLGSMLIISLVRTALDPSVESWKELGMFLSFVIPMLIIRAIISYLTSLYKTRYIYKRSVEKKIKILEFCDK